MFSRDKVHPLAPYTLIVFADSNCSERGVGLARTVPWRGVMFYCFSRRGKLFISVPTDVLDSAASLKL